MDLSRMKNDIAEVNRRMNGLGMTGSFESFGSFGATRGVMPGGLMMPKPDWKPKKKKEKNKKNGKKKQRIADKAASAQSYGDEAAEPTENGLFAGGRETAGQSGAGGTDHGADRGRQAQAAGRGESGQRDANRMPGSNTAGRYDANRTPGSNAAGRYDANRTQGLNTAGRGGGKMQVKLPGRTDISRTDLQQAVIWAELLGEPVSKKRRKRRVNGQYGNPSNVDRG